jgi:acyl-[acyl carrier protein]--UDP-N-acetylglucosamine O-acyltransferase
VLVNPGVAVATKDVLPYSKTVGNRARIYGLNTVGLTRRGFTREQIATRNDNLDIAWLRDTSSDPEDEMTEPDEIAAAVMVHLRAALDQIEVISEELAEPTEVSI